MSRQNHLLHYHISKKKQIGLFDKVVVIAAFLYPMSGIPQVVEVFHGNIDGVSLISWLCFIAFAILFLTYGLVHRITPMIITNALWLIVDFMVVFAIIAHRAMA